ncbi:MAG: hypothetical protein HZC41_26345 [Chloroflexi bacterium]|nr:hypothetical protein [Chloroflexota bacterium]
MLSLPFILSVISTVTSGLFAALVLRRWWQKRRDGHPAPHLLAWGIGMVMYFVGTLAQVVLTLTWSPLFFAFWYWCGALMTAAWLGQGTVYLLWRRGNVARNLQMALILVGVMTLPWTLFLTEFNEAAWKPGADMTQLYRDHVDENGVVQPGIMAGESRGTVRFFSPIMNVWGTIALVGGAIYSAYLFRRKQILRNRMIGNWLIALGGLMPALGGALIRLGDPSFKYTGEMLGAVLLFAGFLLATQAADELREQRRAPAVS